MRVAIIGSGGMGKTTLAQRLADRLRVPVVPEFAREILAEWGVKHLTDLTVQEMARFQREIIVRKIAAESAHNCFVADRSTADNAAHWLLRLVGAVSDSETSEYLEQCQVAMDRYNRLILLPSGSIPIENDGVRDVDIWRQFRYEVVLRGLLSLWRRECYVVKSRTIDERVREVLQHIG